MSRASASGSSGGPHYRRAARRRSAVACARSREWVVAATTAGKRLMLWEAGRFDILPAQQEGRGASDVGAVSANGFEAPTLSEDGVSVDRQVFRASATAIPCNVDVADLRPIQEVDASPCSEVGPGQGLAGMTTVERNRCIPMSGSGGAVAAISSQVFGTGRDNFRDNLGTARLAVTQRLSYT